MNREFLVICSALLSNDGTASRLEQLSEYETTTTTTNLVLYFRENIKVTLEAINMKAGIRKYDDRIMAKVMKNVIKRGKVVLCSCHTIEALCVCD